MSPNGDSGSESLLCGETLPPSRLPDYALGVRSCWSPTGSGYSADHEPRALSPHIRSSHPDQSLQGQPSQGLLSLLTSRGSGCPVLAAALWQERWMNHFKGTFKPPEKTWESNLFNLLSCSRDSSSVSFSLCPALPSRCLSVSLSPSCLGFLWGQGLAWLCPRAP